jgi:chemotaxis signal transduction protein
VQEPIITFEVLTEWFGLLARDVREVARLRAVRKVPRAPESIAGLAEVHGRVVTLIDPERLLPSAQDPAPAGAAGDDPGRERDEFGIVLALPYDHLGLLVRSQVDVASSLDEDTVAPGGSASWLRARLPAGDRLLNLLSLPGLVSRVEESIRAGFLPAPQGPVDEES